MADSLNAETILKIEHDVLNNLVFWNVEGKEAEKTLTYIAGVRDMANAVIKAIKKGDGNGT